MTVINERVLSGISTPTKTVGCDLIRDLAEHQIASLAAMEISNWNFGPTACYIKGRIKRRL